MFTRKDVLKAFSNGFRNYKHARDVEVVIREEIDKINNEILPFRASVYYYLVSFSDSYTFSTRKKDLENMYRELEKGNIIHNNELEKTIHDDL